MTYRITLSSRARRALEVDLPESVAAACAQFLATTVAENPYRVGQRLRPPFAHQFAARRGEFRIIYSVHDDRLVVHVINVRHRRDAYRT